MIVIKDKISKEHIETLPRAVFNGEIHIVDTPQAAEKAAWFLNQQEIVGIDSETRPSFKRGTNHKVALLQISTENKCFLFRVNKSGLTLPVIDLLESKKTLKVGLSLKDDFMALHQRAPFEPHGIIELQEYAKMFGIKDMSLQKIYANLFGEKISKSQQLSNWEADELTIPQQLYAALDAWACLKIYSLLKEIKETGDFIMESTGDE